MVTLIWQHIWLNQAPIWIFKTPMEGKLFLSTRWLIKNDIDHLFITFLSLSFHTFSKDSFVCRTWKNLYRVDYEAYWAWCYYQLDWIITNVNSFSLCYDFNSWISLCFFAFRLFLHLACKKGSFEIAKLLIEHGADYHAKDEIKDR